jgi:hypothetical protein
MNPIEGRVMSIAFQHWNPKKREGERLTYRWLKSKEPFTRSNLQSKSMKTGSNPNHFLVHHQVAM